MSILVQDGRVDPHIPLFTPTVQSISSEALLLLHLQRFWDRNKRDGRTQNVSHTEKKSIDVDVLGTKEMNVLEGA